MKGGLFVPASPGTPPTQARESVLEAHIAYPLGLGKTFLKAGNIDRMGTIATMAA